MKKRRGSKLVRVSKQILNACVGFRYYEGNIKSSRNLSPGHDAIHYTMHELVKLGDAEYGENGKFVGFDKIRTGINCVTLISRCGNCGDFDKITLTKQQLEKLIKVIDTGKII